jgi:hypothetical protein
MNMIAIYVFTTTAFTVEVSSTIEHLAESTSGEYSVVTRKVEARTPFTLDPGVYRISSEAKIAPVHEVPIAAISLADGTPDLGSHVIAHSGTKGNWPDPPAATASAALNIPLDEMEPFLTDSGAETVLDAGPAANG